MNKNLVLYIILLITCTSLILIEGLYLAYLPLYGSLLLSLISFVLFKEIKISDQIVYLLYQILCVLLYYYFKYNLPEWHGFTGMYGEEGTDDSRFYAAIASNSYILPEIANDWGSLLKDHGYSKLLKFISITKIDHPFIVLIPNLVGIALLPNLVSKLSIAVSKGDSRVAKLSYILVLICPFVLTNGLILIRDGWSAFLFTLGIYYIYKNKLSYFIGILVLLTMIRGGSGVLLFIVYIIHYLFFTIKISARHVLYVITGLAATSILLYFIFPYLSGYMIEKGVSLAGRELYIQNYLNDYPDSTISKIYNLPYVLRIPLGFLFFNFLPFLSFDFISDGYVDIRKFSLNVIMPIISLFYFKYFVSGFISLKKRKNYLIIYLIIVYVFTIFVLSQFSLQYRHKTMIMPVFYIIVSYFYYYNTKIGRQVGTLFVIAFLIMQVINLF